MKIIKKLICFTFILLTAFVFWSNNAYASDTLGSMTPIHSYNFDTDTGTTVLDSVTGSAINGTMTAASRITGYNGTGNAIHFNGNSYIALKGSVIPTGAKTITFKIRIGNIPSSTEYIFGNDTYYKTDSGICAAINADGSLSIENAQSGPVFSVNNNKNICDNEWHSILYTWDGTTNEGAAKLYVDDLSTPAIVKTATFTDVKAAKYNLYIGSLAQVSGAKFIGDLDEFVVYNVAYLNMPNSITAIANQETKQINVTWSPIQGVTSYNVYRTETSGTGYIKIGSSTSTSYLDTDPTLTSGKIYYYVITAVSSTSESNYSNEASASLDNPIATPSALKVVLEVDEELQLSVDDELDVNTEMTWISSDKTVATVDAYGVVTALKPGNTVVTVVSKDSTYTDKINVLVVENADDYRLAVDLKVGKSCRLTVDDLTNTVKVTWNSSDTSVATVSNKGKVKALSEGLTLITATDETGNIIGQVYVRVRE